MSRKTVINNLIIIWQGQSWSVIAPDGEVLARFPDQYEAMRYAETNLRYAAYYADAADYVVVDPKPKRGAVYAPAPVSRKPIALKLMFYGITGILLILLGREVMTVFQEGIASVDWGALLVQAVIAIVAVIAAYIAMIVVGAVAGSVVVIAAIILGIAGACGLVTSLLFGWPWSL